MSHGDAIRATLLFVVEMPFDIVDRIEVSPARISVVTCDGERLVVRQMNGLTL